MTLFRYIFSGSAVSFRRAALFPFVLALLISGCGQRGAPRAAPTPDELYARGAAAFEAGRHAQAIEALSSFSVNFLGDPRVPEAQFMLGRAHMARREFLTAVTEFQRLINDFPGHARGQAARHGLCESYFRLAPRAQLDQEYTRAAVLHCEAYAAYFPDAPEAATARQWAAELNGRLAQKLYDTGIFYFRRRAFDAAVIYFNETVEKYPQSTLAPAALSMLIETYTRIGYVEDAEAARERLLREYPQSAEARTLRG
jgi:outer membrane protein assembly factor BamD